MRDNRRTTSLLAYMPDSILVVGGAGYIGSHMVKRLRRAGLHAVVADDLSSGHREAVLGAPLHVGDIGDAAFVDALLGEVRPAAVMHFASCIQVGESVAEPAKYYRNNLTATQVLLVGMRAHGVNRFIFSSTAAIFGDPQYVPIDEAHPKAPINPYGRSKWFVEQMLEDFDRAYGLKSVCLRYFNAAGADPEGELGECHQPETHLVPLILQVAAGRRPHITVYGEDYATADGTCVRDYIHVEDLADAHLLALRQLLAGGGSARYNLGNGNGYSVREVIEDGIDGRLVAESDPVAMADAIEQLLRDPAQASRLAVNARKVALERHGRELMNQRYQALFLELAR